jgi:uncharacterized protein YggE
MKTARLVALAAALAALAAPAIAQTSREPAKLSLSASAEVTAAPDIADIGAGVVTQAVEADAALRATAERMNQVIAALRRAGIPERDIRTTGLTVQPQFRYEPNREPQLVGFQAANRVQVTLREPAATGRIIDALVKAGANQIDGPNFRIANPDPLLDRARAEAVRKARARAEIYAAAAGLKVRRITAIEESQAIRPVPMPRMAMAAQMESAAPSPVAPGEVELSVSLTMAFELEP